ncbi:tyrosine-type recombinase/integrase [Tenacibaculum soleae]|uniref:tyrosine-type recombinase/integrase n=1 Tax=Tenacibaculum soleae TaxID=447689 RepID=UPI002300380B|nr:tyrosine-type recombinase/integrase [Tenacibaculum soleae]
MKVVEIYIKKLTNKNYSSKTIETYVCYLEKFLHRLNKNPYHITTKDIENYLLSNKYSSISQQNQVIGSLKLYAKYILNKKAIHLNKIERPRKERKLPKIIDAELLSENIKNIQNLKHKAILTLGLSCGLRISEVINLKWEHLDRTRNILNVVNGKGKKDRTTILNDNLISLLSKYWCQYKSKEYVFNGQFSNKYSASSIQRLVKKYIHPKASFHLLRHSFATYALDNGTELAPLSGIMGHNSTKTTEIYYHLSVKSMATIKQAI